MIPDGAFLALLIAFGLLLAFALHKLIACPTNRLEWTDLVATNGYLNAYKLGYWVGVIGSTWIIIHQEYAGTLEGGTMGIWLAFLGGVPVASSAIRSTQKPKVDNPDA